MVDHDDDEATVIRARRSTSAPARADDAGEDAEATIIRLIEPPRPASLRRAGGALGATLPDDPPPLVPLEGRGAPAAPNVTAAPVFWAVRLPGTAVVVPLDRPLVVGRRPGAVRPGEHPHQQQLVIPPDRADVSGRHARLEQLGETLVVTDLGSTNGTVVHWSAGAPRRLRPGESCAVLPDARIELGEGVVLEFVPAPATPRPEPPNPEPPS